MIAQDNLANNSIPIARISAVSNHEAVVKINNPCLQTLLECSMMRLGFLKKCRKLKRPCKSLRVNMSKLLYKNKPNSFSEAVSSAEKILLEKEIVEKTKNIYIC